MAANSSSANLQIARSLAHKLFGQCRSSPSSYKLLAGSVRELRNILEDIEDFLEGSNSLDLEDTRLSDGISHSRELLERLDLSLQSYHDSQETDVKDSDAADLKTALDVAWKNLRSAHDAITNGEIPLKLDTSCIPPAVSQSAGWNSVSTSLVDSEQGRRPSTQTSSAWSLLGPDGPEKGALADVPGLRLDGRYPPGASEEKEVYDHGSAYLKHSLDGTAPLTLTPSLDWKSLFMDPMSTSIEQASNMILKDDDLSPNVTSRPRSTTEPPAVTNDGGIAPPSQIETPVLAGLGISTPATKNGRSAIEQESNSTEALRTRALSESPFPESLAKRGLQNEGIPSSNSLASNYSTYLRPSSKTSVVVSSGSGSVRPSSSPKVPPRRRRAHSNSSIASPTQEAEDAEIADFEDSRRSAEGMRKELSMVIESAFGDTDEPVLTPLRPEDSQAGRQRATVESTPPPPSRKPPPPPSKQRKPPKVPKRASTYRIVNLSPPDDSSSSEDDLYSSSKPTSPVEQRRESRSHFVEFQNSQSTPDNRPRTTSVSKDAQITADSPPKSATESKSIPIANGERLPELTPPHQRLGRSQLGFMSKLSVPNLSTHRYPKGQSPPLRRHITSAEVPRDSTSVFDGSSSRPAQAPVALERAATAATHHRSASSNANLIPTSTQLAPLAATVGMRPVSAGNEVLPGSTGSMPRNGMTTVAGREAEQRPSLSATIEKEIVPLTGLETRKGPTLSDAFDKEVNAKSMTASRSMSVLTHASGNAPQPMATLQRSVSGIEVRNPADPEWYAPGSEVAETTELTAERINHIVHFWNCAAWDQAGIYLKAYLEILIEQNDLARARRVRHLLGICASYKGQWVAAIPHFLSVLSGPVSEESAIDDGDCAAGYWLGDTYSMLNQRTEALLAYCLAERSSMFRDTRSPRIVECLLAEQEAVQLGGSRTDFTARWNKEAPTDLTGDPTSILDPRVITKATAKSLLEYELRRTRRIPFTPGHDQPFHLDPNKARFNAFTSLDSVIQVGKYYLLKLKPTHFELDSPWPVMFDPFFAMANVLRGRLLTYECDMLAVFNSNADAKIPKSSAMTLNRLDSFTAADLNWLITTIRDCLRMLEMEWSEVANVEGSWFVVRYSFMQSKIATTYYFSISLFRQSFRSGYSIEICPDGICSARVARQDWEHQKGVHNTESKRVKKLIREFLDEAAKSQLKVKKKEQQSMPSQQLSATGVLGNADPLPPPLPARPPNAPT